MPNLSEPKQNVFQSLDVRARGVGLFCLIFLAFLFDDPRFNLVILLITIGIASSARLAWTKIRQTLLPLIPLLIMIMLFASFNTGNWHFQQKISQTVLYELWPSQHWNITYGGLFQGMTFLLRMLILVLTSMIFQWTTPLEELTQLLQKLKLPSQLSFMLVTAIRFIPVLNRKRVLIMEAQKARGAYIPEKGIGVPIQTFLPLVIPMFASSIQMANTLSMAMMSRGFGYAQYRTNAVELKFRIRDGITVGVAVIFLVIGLYFRIVLNWCKL